MAGKPRKCCPPKRVAAAPWADPLLAMQQGSWKFTAIPVTVIAFNRTNQVIAPADPSRYMIGIVSNSVLSLDQFAPEGVAHPFGWQLEIYVQWFSLFDYGPIVPAAWTVRTITTSIIGVYEVYRLQ